MPSHLGQTAIHANGPELKIGLLRRASSIRPKDDAAAVRLPTTSSIDSRVIGQPLRIAAGRCDYVNVGVTGDRRGERDLRAVRREVRIDLD
jgi:hypothetical protein